MVEPRQSKAGFGQPFAPPFQPAFPQKAPEAPPGPTKPGQAPPKTPAGVPPGGAPQAPAPKPGPSIPSAGPSEETIEFVTESIVSARTPDVIPMLMRRCIVDVWTKPQLLGTTKREKFRGAVAISLASLMRSGRVFVDSRGLVQATPKGRQEQMKRVVAPDRTLKESAFRRIMTEVKIERPPAK